ncbi:MAG: hypothetical protein RI935_103 [Candidatus Parcubacteria bacterium]|jgi:hypothetical protein
MIQQTIHGHQRLLERTKARDEDILDILNNNAAVLLGEIEEIKFFLFYSPNDKDYKVALVSNVSKNLVTILETNHKLPFFIKQRIHRDKKEAKNKLQQFILKELAATSPKEEKLPSTKIREQQRIELKVFEDIVPQHTFSFALPNGSSFNRKGRGKALACVKEEIKEKLKIVASCFPEDKVPITVSYSLAISRGVETRTIILFKKNLRHAALVNMLSTAT